jgi:hypothetical protein
MQYNALQTIQAFEAGQGQRKQREYDAGRQKLGNALAMGDLKGGASTAFGMGDIETGMALQTQQRTMLDAEGEKRRNAMMAASMALLKRTEGPERQAFVPQVLETMRLAGIDVPPDALSQMDLSTKAIEDTLTALQDPETLLAQYQKAQEPYTLAPGAQRFSGREVIASNVKPEAPLSTVGKLAADLSAGRITQAQYDGEIARMQRSEPSLSVDFSEGGALAGITYGSAPKGKEAAIVRGADGQPLVSPVAQQADYNKAIRGLGEFEAQNAIVIEDIDRALGAISGWSTGAGAALKDLPIVGGITPAGQMESLLETIQANVGFDKLQAMREASPTGGALGSVTEKELAFLQAVFGSLRQDTSPENVRYNLTRLKQHMQGRESRLQAAIAADFPTLQQTAQFRAQTNQQVQALTAEEAAELEQLRREIGGQ